MSGELEVSEQPPQGATSTPPPKLPDWVKLELENINRQIASLVAESWTIEKGTLAASTAVYSWYFAVGYQTPLSAWVLWVPVALVSVAMVRVAMIGYSIKVYARYVLALEREYWGGHNRGWETYLSNLRGFSPLTFGSGLYFAAMFVLAWWIALASR